MDIFYLDIDLLVVVTDGLMNEVRPAARWADHTVKTVARTCISLVQDRDGWLQQKEAYAQQSVKLYCG